MGILLAGLLALLVFPAADSRSEESGEGLIPVRIGWQMPAATQAQIVQVLKRSNLLESHGMEPILVPFSYGGPQINAAFSGELDVLFAGDQPAMDLIARGGKWKIVARLYDDRTSIIVPPESAIQSVQDLKGRTLASPFGSVAQREAVLEQRAAGLDPDRDVKNINLDIIEIGNRVESGGVEAWKGIDAAVAWEPIVSELEQRGIARILTSKRTMGVVAVSEEFIDGHPEATLQVLVALVRAWDFYARNPDRVMQWYIEDSHLNYHPDALVAARLDQNFSKTSPQDIDLYFNQQHLAALEQAAVWARSAEGDQVSIDQVVDQDLLARAMQTVAAAQFEDISIILPSTNEMLPADVVHSNFLEAAPLGVVFAMMVLIALLAIEAGFWFGRHSGKQSGGDLERPVSTVVGAVLAMMAFVIALTFGSANNRFDARKVALLEDVSAIQTAYLRAKLLPEPQRTTVRSLLRDYVHVRVGIAHAYNQPETLKHVQRRAIALQGLMWSHVESLKASGNDARFSVFFAAPLNDVFNLHTKRVVLGAYYQIPGFVWFTLILASGVAMFAVGFQFGLTGGHRSHPANLALAMTFALVILLAIDLDRAGEGMISVSQQPMVDLLARMNSGN